MPIGPLRSCSAWITANPTRALAGPETAPIRSSRPAIYANFGHDGAMKRLVIFTAKYHLGVVP